MQPWCTPFPIWNQSVVPCPVLTVASWPAYRFLERQVRWSGIPISFRIFHKGGIICISEVIGISPSNLDSNLCFIQPGISHEVAMAPHSGTLAWKIPWMEEPGRLQSTGSRRVGYNWVTWLSLFTFMHWRRKWQPTPVFLPGESQGRGTWWAAIYGVAESDMTDST